MKKDRNKNMSYVSLLVLMSYIIREIYKVKPDSKGSKGLKKGKSSPKIC